MYWLTYISKYKLVKIKPYNSSIKTRLSVDQCRTKALRGEKLPEQIWFISFLIKQIQAYSKIFVTFTFNLNLMFTLHVIRGLLTEQFTKLVFQISCFIRIFYMLAFLLRDKNLDLDKFSLG